MSTDTDGNSQALLQLIQSSVDQICAQSEALKDGKLEPSTFAARKYHSGNRLSSQSKTDEGSVVYTIPDRRRRDFESA